MPFTYHTTPYDVHLPEVRNLVSFCLAAKIRHPWLSLAGSRGICRNRGDLRSEILQRWLSSTSSKVPIHLGKGGNMGGNIGGRKMNVIVSFIDYRQHICSLGRYVS